ncbi:MAG: IS3 family transposase [Chloroflexota bacterium]|nr:IS3 family transposase [Chloroflexota bacterium]
MIDLLRPHYSVTLLCRLLEYPRRSYDYVAVPADDTVLRSAIEQIMIRWPFYGYRRVTAQLRREGWTINSKLVRRLLHELGRACRVGRVRWHTTDSAHGLPRYPNLVRELVVTAPDQAWCADITYVRLGQGFIYLAVILDLDTRGAWLACESQPRPRTDVDRLTPRARPACPGRTSLGSGRAVRVARLHRGLNGGGRRN